MISSVPRLTLFIARHPPQSPALVEFGGAFALFLAAFEPAGSLSYLTDIARMEWARHAAYHAADAAPADLVDCET